MDRRALARILSPPPVFVLLAGIACAGMCRAEEPFDDVETTIDENLPDRNPGDYRRGRFSIGYQTQHTKGLILDNGDIPGTTTTDMHAIALALDYRLNDRWEAHVALPFIRKRSSGGPGAHQLDGPTGLHPDVRARHPQARFLDDGNYHSAWQDWTIGLSYHTNWGRFHIEPHVIATIPSHHYSFFANAAIGQDLDKLKFGFDISRRLAFSNFYYSGGYSYEFVEKVLGIGLNKHHLRLSGGYFFTPQLSARIFANGRYGQGRDTSDFPVSVRGTEFAYQHDRLSRHNYAIAGLGASYQINDAYAVSLTGASMVWGRTVHDLKYAYELQLARSF